MHSESYLARRNNPTFEIKPLDEHIAHFKKRLFERFNILCDDEMYNNILQSTKTGSPYKSHKVYSINSQSSIRSVMVNGVEIWVIYGVKTHHRDIHVLEARLKTALYPNRYIVPDCLSDKFDNYEFTDKVNEFINEIKALSNDIKDINDNNEMKAFFQRTDKHHKILSAAKWYKKFGSLRFNVVDSLISLLR